ncbi:family 78 glycoside hydrolase catalytic domain [Solirubrobacter sp. CPCC 204708]|uniref:alpha-L-rhamnosidase n=1 Tax=Solirubrobacter deserti TaxID=2282478 RepID=A0ABT4RE36_9ACTN|nr:family 78 glycoside hydrolase catalytic domain [Solirubrobacter deserti]MBE2316045.1 family 78 glycoside hydrolase catalytic domain [Solirubrobacter deserti]MDA0136797.1 family 78 glycoside hydrolase catalytic domain [Solirubrobacter deserti]
MRRVLIAAVIVLACPAGAMAATPAGLTVEHQTQPLAVEAAAPLLGWHGAGDAYQVKVGTSPQRLGDVWDSGKVTSSESVNVPYGGPPLPAATRLYWTVRTFDGDRASAYAPPASFGTAVKSSWTATPIWSSAPVLGSDYDVELDFTVTTVAAGVKFRVNGPNAFMWQIRGDASNELRPHVQVNGTYSQLKAVKLPMTIGLNTKHKLRINAAGSTIRTYIDDVLVDTTVDARNPAGSIGFRHGMTESARFDNVKVTGDRVLYSNDFTSAGTDFACGSVSNGELVVGTARDCAYGVTDNWAFLRKAFRVADKPIAWATAYVSGRSTEPARQYVFKLSLNGKVVGVGPTRAINNATQTMYNAYDVTPFLQPGDNALGALAYTTTDKKFIAQLVIAYADGTREVVNSDTSWKALSGEVALPQAGSVGTSYYAAPVENIDARAYPSGFDTPAFDDAAWADATAKTAIQGLTGTPAANVEQRLRAPVRVVKKADKHYFVDFGRTVVGGMQLRLSGPGTVELRYGEELTDATTVDHTMRTGNTYRDVWTLRPGTQTLSPWGYRVFRYAEIIGAEPEDIQAASLVYPFDPNASSWSSSNADLDKVVDFNREGVRELNLDLHLDSPSRERAPYEGDNLIHMLIQGYTDGDWTLSKHTLQWLAVNETWPTEWRLASILSAHEYWRNTGDLKAVADYYEDLKGFVPMRWIRASDGLVQKEPGNSSQANGDLVDWPQGERDGYVFSNVNTVINAWSYKALADMAQIAAALDKTEDAATWSAAATRLKAAINTHLFENGRYKDGLTASHASVHASVFAVAMGVAGPEQLGPATQYIAERGIACSVFCANFLIDALYDGGRAEDAVRLMTSTGQRSWLHIIEQGAGSPMEAWDPALKSNTTFSHPWSASPAYLVYRGALGIEALEPGYKRFSVKPQPGGLTRAAGTTPTVRGEVGAAFEQLPSGLDLAVKVPANSTAVVTLPGRFPVEVGAGCHLLSTRGGVTAESVREWATAQGCVFEAPPVDVGVGGEVPAVLSLAVGSATFAPFVPGVAAEYTANTTATVTSTAGDAALSVSEPGHLANGAYALREPLRVELGKAAWTGPVGKEDIDVTFKQAIGASEPLRTGRYSRTLTFTLSTTTP